MVSSVSSDLIALKSLKITPSLENTVSPQLLQQILFPVTPVFLYLMGRLLTLTQNTTVISLGPFLETKVTSMVIFFAHPAFTLQNTFHWLLVPKKKNNFCSTALHNNFYMHDHPKLFL